MLLALTAPVGGCIAYGIGYLFVAPFQGIQIVDPVDRYNNRLHDAECGYFYSQMTVADLYRRGDGTERDLVQAYKWYTIAIRNPRSYVKQPHDLKAIFRGRSAVSFQMTREQVETAKRLVAE